MDIAEYWKTIKKQSKAIAGVKRVGAGLFKSSGIGPSLDNYIKAAKTGDPRKIQKTAGVAMHKCAVYMKTIHNKEMQNKKEYSPAELKSMAIIGKACNKILDRLTEAGAVGKASAGSFGDDDAARDAKKSADDFIEPKIKKALDEHLQLRKRMVPESARLLKKYQSEASQVPNYLKIGKKGAAQAVASRRAGNTSDNIQAMDLTTRALEEIQGIRDSVGNGYEKNVERHSCDIAKARQDVGRRVLNKVPEPYHTNYVRESGKYFKAMDDNAVTITNLVKNLRGAVAEAESYVDVAEANSMEAVDPAKLIKKVKAIQAAAEKTKKDLNVLSDTVKSTGIMATEVANGSLDFDAKLKAMKTRVEFFKKYMARAKALAQQENALKKRLSTIGASVEDRGVLDAIGEVDATFKDATALLHEIQKFGAASKQQITAAVTQIKAEGARAT